MNKWLIAISSLLIILIVIIFGLYLSPVILGILNPHPTTQPASSQLLIPSNNISFTQVNGFNLKIQSGNHQDSEGLTKKEKMDAIDIALNNSTIRETMQRINDYRYISVENVTSVNASKTGSPDSGFLNISSKIAYISIRFEGAPMSLTLDNYIVYVDVLNNKMLGMVIYRGKAGPTAYVTILQGAIWYHQITGAAIFPGPGNVIRMAPTIMLNIDDVKTTSPMILSTDNFEKLRSGSTYKALEYVDFETNATRIADGSQPLNIIAINDGNAIWRANVTLGHEPIDLNYYMVVENENKDKEINISYWE